MIDFLIHTAYVIGAWLTIGVLAVCAVILVVLAESDETDGAGSTLTGCHLDDRDEMVTTRFVTSEEINRRVENMRPPLYDDRAMRN